MKITTPNGILEAESIEAILEKYGRDCLRGADLCHANLNGADLSGADLRGADLWRADLGYAILYHANLNGADLSGAILCHANLNGADLGYAILRHANLNGADLGYAILRHANLNGADLGYAILYHANLNGADLGYAILYHANLNGADLSGANLCHAHLNGADLGYAILCQANLNGADLSGANHVKLSIAKISILPDEGDIIGWKKASADDETPIIVKLLIPADAQRSNSTGRKCRASKARILDLQDLDGDSLPPDTTAHSQYDRSFPYRKGETVHVEDFDTNRWNECAPGIHFFITRIEAVEY